MSDWCLLFREACALETEPGFIAGDARRLASRSGGRPASVLIPIQSGEQPTVLFTKRSEWLTHHPGQISFPGGRAEAEDSSSKATALREAQEEIGLTPAAVSILGELPVYRTVTGFAITPHVGWLAPSARYQSDGVEVVRLIQVPLAGAMDAASFRFRYREYEGTRYRIFSLDYDGDHIWGATAAILCDLAKRVARVRGQDFDIAEYRESDIADG